MNNRQETGCRVTFLDRKPLMAVILVGGTFWILGQRF